MFVIRSVKFLTLAFLSSYLLVSCFSSSEDDAALEAQEPTQAEPQKDMAATEDSGAADATIAPEAAVAPEAKPAESIAIHSASPASADPAHAANVLRRVMYVKANGAVMREKPDAKSKVVRRLTKGDHFLVNIDGEWAKTDDGKYISMKSLSEKGIGRAKRGAAWTGGRPGESVAPPTSTDPTAKPVGTTKKLPSKTVLDNKSKSAAETPKSSGGKPSSDSGGETEAVDEQ